jgi:hypothetical protein
MEEPEGPKPSKVGKKKVCGCVSCSQCKSGEGESAAKKPSEEELVSELKATGPK